MELRGRVVLVLGIGESGTAAARLLVREGAQVRCSDGGAGPEVRRRAAALEKIGCRVEFGGHTADFSRGVSLAVLSPGIDPSVPAVRRLRDAGTELISEIELAFALCRRPVTAVTGTNGKTTVVTLIERILREDGRRADACGNIGRAFSDCVRNDGEEGIFVVEASSFQLEASRRFRPRVAVASSTMRAMRASVLPSPAAVTRITSAPSAFTLPATTGSPGPRVTGTLSPVTGLSSRAD